ncbi:MAG: lysophospholipid acyltransferase family protein [Nitrospinae bacterium]|nr:lysophospholipid acyltransferase family protein [Nitrospinota bacterium]
MSMIIEWIQYVLILLFIKVINLFPFKISLKMGRFIGLLLYLFDARHRNVAINNLMASFPEKSRDEIKRIGRESFGNIGSTVAEMARVFKGGREWIDGAVRFEGRENVENALKKGKGVLAVTAHIGNWEVGALASARDLRLNFVVRPLDNRFINRLIYKLRTAFNSGVIAKKSAIREILRCLNKNEIVAILMDQNTGREEGVFVDFFGRKACTTPVVALLSLRTGAPVIPAFTIREGDGKFKMIIGEEIEVVPSGDNQRDIERYTAIFTGAIESIIRKYPDQWFWLHRRWKTKPE